MALPDASSPTLDRHQLLRHRLVGGLRGDVRHVRGQAARRGEGRQHGVGGGQALRLELVEQHAGEGIAQLLQRLGRQFLDEQFDEQVLRCVMRFRPPSSCICATHSRGAIGKPSRSRLS